jgi:type IV secretion system protein VirB1
MDFFALAQECAPIVAPPTLAALAWVESNHNPYAIGVVDGHVKQPATLDEAVKTAEALEAAGKNFSVGIAQVNRYNLKRYGLTYRAAFEPCQNLRVGAKILAECYSRASGKYDNTQAALHAALSCYYSGNFTRGFKPDEPGQKPYVHKVLAAAGLGPLVPSLTAPPRPTGAARTLAPGSPARPLDDGPVLLSGKRIAPRAASSLASREETAPRNPKVAF